MPSPNEQFGASGGAVSSDTEQVTSSFALVRALPMPPPAAKPPGVRRQQGTAQSSTVNFDSDHFDSLATNSLKKIVVLIKMLYFCKK